MFHTPEGFGRASGARRDFLKLAAAGVAATLPAAALASGGLVTLQTPAIAKDGLEADALTGPTDPLLPAILFLEEHAQRGAAICREGFAAQDERLFAEGFSMVFDASQALTLLPCQDPLAISAKRRVAEFKIGNEYNTISLSQELAEKLMAK